MKQAHTPGPWHRNIPPATKYPIIFAGRNTHVAMVDTHHPAEVVEANIELIRRAPAMEELLERVSDYLDQRADVEDGDYGEPRPNQAMSLKHEVDVLLGRATDGF